MTAAKKAPTPPKAATPSAKASVSPQARETAPPAPSDAATREWVALSAQADPGPWVQVDDGLHELTKASPSGLMESAAVPEHWNADGSPRPGNPLLGESVLDPVGPAAEGDPVPIPDPGPPPMIPVPGEYARHYHPAIQVYEAGRQLYGAADLDPIRQNVMAVDVFRMPPSVQQYKAEVLAWLNAMEAYAARIKQN